MIEQCQQRTEGGFFWVGSFSGGRKMLRGEIALPALIFYAVRFWSASDAGGGACRGYVKPTREHLAAQLK